MRKNIASYPHSGACRSILRNTFNGAISLLTLVIAILIFARLPTVTAATTATAQKFSVPVQVAPSTLGVRTVSCDPGSFATGGGADTTLGPGLVSLAVASSFPTTGLGGIPDGWMVDAFNPTSYTLNLTAVVVCMTPVPGVISSSYVVRGSIVSVPAGGYLATASVQCNSGDYAMGGGSDTDHGAGGVSLAVSDTFATLTSGVPRGWEVIAKNPTGQARNLAADVVCSSVPTYRVVSPDVTIVAGGYAWQYALCHSGGDIAVGGGPSTSIGPGNATLRQARSYGSNDESGPEVNVWDVFAYNPTSYSLNLVSVATCMVQHSGEPAGCGVSQTCNVATNSTISSVDYSDNALHFNLTGAPGTHGYVNATVPKSRIADINQVKVYQNGTEWPYTYSANATHYFIYFTCTFHSTINANISLGVVIAPISPISLLAIGLTSVMVLRSVRVYAERKH